MRAILLGHTGFVGAALARELTSLGLTVEGFSTKTADLADSKAAAFACSRADDAVVILASALTLDAHPDTVGLYEKNVAMAVNVARALEGKKPALVAYLSSFVVYGDAPGVVGEDSPAKPATLYAASKLAGERVLAAAKLPLLTLRLARVYGPGARGAVYGPVAFVRSIRERGVVELFGDGSESRDHLYIDDAARMCARLISDGRTGAYNVAGGESRSFREVADVLAKISPRPFQVVEKARTRPATSLGLLDAARVRRDAPLALTSFEEGLKRTFDA